MALRSVEVFSLPMPGPECLERLRRPLTYKPSHLVEQHDDDDFAACFQVCVRVLCCTSNPNPNPNPETLTLKP